MVRRCIRHTRPAPLDPGPFSPAAPLTPPSGAGPRARQATSREDRWTGSRVFFAGSAKKGAHPLEPTATGPFTPLDPREVSRPSPPWLIHRERLAPRTGNRMTKRSCGDTQGRRCWMGRVAGTLGVSAGYLDECGIAALAPCQARGLRSSARTGTQASPRSGHFGDGTQGSAEHGLSILVERVSLVARPGRRCQGPVAEHAPHQLP